MKYSIVLCLVILAVVSCMAEDAVAPEKKTEKRGIYGGFGYGHYHSPIVSHGYLGYGGYHGGYLGHGYYGHGLYGGYYPGFHGYHGHHY